MHPLHILPRHIYLTHSIQFAKAQPRVSIPHSSDSRLTYHSPHVVAKHLIAAAAMAPTDALSAPGAVAYSSDKMSVGDGTWDFTKNDFLLPNLQGLPFEMMQYNGKHTPYSTRPLRV